MDRNGGSGGPLAGNIHDLLPGRDCPHRTDLGGAGRYAQQKFAMIFYDFLLPSPYGRHRISRLNRLVAFCFQIQPLKGRTLETIWNYLEPRAQEIRDSLTHFMLNHSSIEPRKPYDEIWYMSPEGDRYYAELDRVGMKMQSYLSECYGQFYSMLQPLLEDQHEDVLAQISKSKEVITRTIEHRLTFCDNTKHALQLALAALEDQLKILKDISEEKIRTGN